MGEFGLTVKHDTGGKRIEIECKHQNGLLYVVPSEANWVCTEDLMHAHALGGFMKQLSELNDTRVTDAMRRWGIYYRPRELAEEEGMENSEKTAKEAP
ncbi:MAG: hypothetical protein O2854_00380 [Chloroflexi bacterium]|nr:hypothetical protein [Chloroflexota bacterium]